MPQKFEYTVLDLIENAARNNRVSPLNLGGVAGVGGGAGGPPGGFIGWLPQGRVAYDMDELGIPYPIGSGSILDNLNHIRYRLDVIESGGINLKLDDIDGIPTINPLNWITFSGATVIDLGGGHAQVNVGGGGGGGGLTSLGVYAKLTYYPKVTSTADLGSQYYYLESGEIADAGYGYPINASNTFIIGFITHTSFPAVNQIANVKVFIAQNSNVTDKAAKLYAELYKRSAGGSNTLLETSGETAFISQGLERRYEIDFTGTYSLSSTDRLLIKVYGNPYGSGTNPYTNLQFGHNTHYLSKITLDGILADATYINIDDEFLVPTVSGGILDVQINEERLDREYLSLHPRNNGTAGYEQRVIQQIQVITEDNGWGAYYGETTGDAYTADFEAYTVDDDITSPTLFLYRETDGTGNITSPMIEVSQGAYGSGTADGDFISLEDADFNPLLRIDKVGEPFLNDVFIAPDYYQLHDRTNVVNSDDDEFKTNTLGSYTQVLPAGGNVTWSVSNGCMNVIYDSITNGDAACVLKALTGFTDGHWLETSVRTLMQSGVNYTGRGLALSNGTSSTSNIMVAMMYTDSTLGRVNFRIDYGTITNFTGTAGSASLDVINAGAIRLRLKRASSTSYDWYAGLETGGVFYNWGNANFNPGWTPTHGGLFVMNWGQTGKCLASFDYFRHMS